MGVSYDEALADAEQYFYGETDVEQNIEASTFLNKYALSSLDGSEYYETTPDDMHRRLAGEFARIEQNYPNSLSEEEIYSYLKDFQYIIPQGSVMAGCGNDIQILSLSNCFVIRGHKSDSYGGIFKTDEEQAQLMKRRAGVGHDISHLRPKGAEVSNAAQTSTGAASFMHRFSNTTREVAQCIHKSTRVLTKEGLETVDNIEPGDDIWTENGWTTNLKTIRNTKDTIKIRTKYGKEIICSEDHIIHTKNGERKAGELSEGDVLTQIVGEGWNGSEVTLDIYEYDKHPHNNSNRLNESITLPTKVDRDFAYFLGFTFGNGSVIRNQRGEIRGICLSTDSKNEEIVDKLVPLIKRLFNYDVTVEDKSGEDTTRLRIHSTLLAHHLDCNGFLKEESENIEFPSELLGAKKRILFSFLSGYFDADGCSQDSKKVYKVSSVASEFLSDVQMCLQAHGIVSNMHVEDRSNKGWEDLYTLTVNGEKNQDLFRKLMSESKKVSLSPEYSKRTDWLRTAYQTTDFDTRSYRHNYINSNDQYVSYTVSDRLSEDLGEDFDIRLLHDEIESVEEHGKDEEVYDLVLNDTNLFFANGLYVHNSGRRGALMLTIDIRHPDAEAFIDMKTDETSVTGANVSVRTTDEFVEAARNGEDFVQTFPIEASPEEADHVQTVDAARIWKKMCDNAWEYAEPGCIFWDKILRESPADCYDDKLGSTKSTNPCGEIPLTPYDSCRLTAMNLSSFVEKPYTKDAEFNFGKYYRAVRVAQRIMDDIVDLEIEQVEKIIEKVKNDPEPKEVKRTELRLWQKIKEKAQLGRRTGLGVTALGDTLASLNYRYGSEDSFTIVDEIFKTHKEASYEESVNLAIERGAFPMWDWEKEKDNPFISRLPEGLQDHIKQHGRRNVSNLTIAPTGTVSLMARTTSGIENMFKPVYFRSRKVNPDDPNQDWDYEDKVGDKWKEFTVFENGFEKWLKTVGYDPEEVKSWNKDKIEELVEESPYHGATVEDVNWVEKVRLQGLIQDHIDHSISVTTNLPEDIEKEKVQEVYETAFDSGCKGITVYRQGSRSGVLNEESQASEGVPRTDAPSRPDELPCDLHKIRYQGDNWKVLIGLYDETPYEVFAFKTHGDLRMVDSSNQAFDRGRIVKEDSGVYNLEAPDGKVVVEDINSRAPNDEVRELTRMISLSLRHGAKLDYVVEQLQKAEGSIVSFSTSVLKALRHYYNGEITAINPDCPDESSCEIVYEEGCMSCEICGYSACS